jgi:hypothetical protein
MATFLLQPSWPRAAVRAKPVQRKNADLQERKAAQQMLSSINGKQALVHGIITFSFASVMFAQSVPHNQNTSANDLVRAVVDNELVANEGHRDRWMYRVEKEERGKKQIKEVIQTGQGSLDRVVAIDGRPLTAKEQDMEIDRIENLVKKTAEQRKLEGIRNKDAEQCKTVFKVFPDALSFTYAGRDGNLTKLSYRPNPEFKPGSMEARVLHEMEGEMWVDEVQHRLVRIRGQLMTDVKFAGGLLGHLEKGGHFMVEQRELARGEWNLVTMEVDMKGKALLLKNIAVQQKEFRHDFRPVPDTLTFAEAADMLMNKVIVASNDPH